MQEYKLRDYAEWDRLDVMQMEAYKIPGFSARVTRPMTKRVLSMPLSIR